MLEGGGAKGAYALGCLRAFHERGIAFHSVSGSSAGALNAVLFATSQLPMGFAIWENVTLERLFQVNILLVLPLFIRILIDSFWSKLSQGAPGQYSEESRLFRRLAFTVWCYLTVIPGTVLWWYLGWSDINPLIPLIVLGIFFLLLSKQFWFHPMMRSHLFGVVAVAYVGATAVVVYTYATGKGAGGARPMGFGLHLMCITTTLILIALIASHLNVALLVPGPLKRQLANIVARTPAMPLYVTTATQCHVWDPDRVGWREWDPEFFPGEYCSIGRDIYVPHYHLVNGLSKQKRITALIASAALPFGITPRVAFRSRSNRYTAHIDGGIADNIPIYPIVQQHDVDELVVVRLRPHKSDFDYLQHWRNVDRSIRLKSYTSEPPHQGSECRAYLNDPPKELPFRQPRYWPNKIVTIAPAVLLGGKLGTFAFKSSSAREWMRMGYEDALRTIDSELT